jgi:hypothetical protein
LISLLNGRGDTAAVEFVGKLSSNLQRAALIWLSISEVFTDLCFLVPPAREEDYWIPSEADLFAYTDVLPIKKTSDLAEWESLLGGEAPLGSLDELSFLKMAERAALHRSAQAQNGITHEVGDEDQTAAALSLEELLGPFYSNLLEEVRGMLAEAERVLEPGRQVLDPRTFLRNATAAFETQLNKAVLPRLARVPNARNPGLPFKTLGKWEEALREDDFKQTLSEAGFDPEWLLHAVKEIKLFRNQVSHAGRRLSEGEVRKLRMNWYGLEPGSRSLFGALTPAPIGVAKH